MKNKTSITHLTRLCLCALLAVVVSSCEFTTGYYIEQEIADHACEPGAFLKTKIWHKGDIVKSWYDEIEFDTPDTLKCYRLKQAHKFVEKCKSIEASCNNR